MDLAEIVIGPAQIQLEPLARTGFRGRPGGFRVLVDGEDAVDAPLAAVASTQNLAARLLSTGMIAASPYRAVAGAADPSTPVPARTSAAAAPISSGAVVRCAGPRRASNSSTVDFWIFAFSLRVWHRFLEESRAPPEGRSPVAGGQRRLGRSGMRARGGGT
ncbi:hypothetical protein GCM10029992_50350 [Glycomyces albus]